MPELPENVKKMLDHYNGGLEAYRARQWDSAVEQFKKALEFVPEDGPSRLYISRCMEYKDAPPPDDWNGVYEAKTK